MPVLANFDHDGDGNLDIKEFAAALSDNLVEQT